MPAPHIASEIRMRPIGALLPYAQNPRTHTEEQIDPIEASIHEFGFTNPVLVDEVGEIIAGHGRILAAARPSLAMEELPTIEIAYLTPEQKRAYRIADNQLALNAGWSPELLRLELTDLKGSGYDLRLLGFDDLQLADWLGQGAGAAPQLPKIKLADRFGVPPFTVLDARQGYWQARKAAWLALGIQSELGRGEIASGEGTGGHNAAPGGGGAQGAWRQRGRKPNAIPGGSLMPAVDRRTGRIVRSDSRSRPIAQS